METQAIKVLIRGCLSVLQQPARIHPVDLKAITPTIITISVLMITVDLIVMVLTSTEDILFMMSIFTMHQEEEVMAGATILMMLITIVHQQNASSNATAAFYAYNASAESFDISYRKNT
eukprot:127373-Ditylum_brightwellii.AAC.1